MPYNDQLAPSVLPGRSVECSVLLQYWLEQDACFLKVMTVAGMLAVSLDDATWWVAERPAECHSTTQSAAQRYFGCRR